MLSKRALAIVNMLLFVFILSILTGIVMAIATSNTKVIESHIRRGKAQYLAEAGNVINIDANFSLIAFPGASIQAPWTYAGDTAGALLTNRTVSFTRMYPFIIGWPLNYAGFSRINSTVNYNTSY